jgi:hypothetical protein
LIDDVDTLDAAEVGRLLDEETRRETPDRTDWPAAVICEFRESRGRTVIVEPAENSTQSRNTGRTQPPEFCAAGVSEASWSTSNHNIYLLSPRIILTHNVLKSAIFIFFKDIWQNAFILQEPAAPCMIFRISGITQLRSGRISWFATSSMIMKVS